MQKPGVVWDRRIITCFCGILLNISPFLKSCNGPQMLWSSLFTVVFFQVKLKMTFSAYITNPWPSNFCMRAIFYMGRILMVWFVVHAIPFAVFCLFGFPSLRYRRFGQFLTSVYLHLTHASVLVCSGCVVDLYNIGLRYRFQFFLQLYTMTSAFCWMWIKVFSMGSDQIWGLLWSRWFQYFIYSFFWSSNLSCIPATN